MENEKFLSPGGNGGDVFVFARKIQGEGKITADGGDGSVGGKGGRVQIVTEENNFTGTVSARGGRSLLLKTESVISKIFWQIVVPFILLIVGAFVIYKLGWS